MAKPAGGVTVKHEGSLVTIAFERPSGWAVTHDGAVICAKCARKARPPAGRRRKSTIEGLAEAMADEQYGQSSLLARPLYQEGTSRRPKKGEMH